MCGTSLGVHDETIPIALRDFSKAPHVRQSVTRTRRMWELGKAVAWRRRLSPDTIQEGL